MGIETEKLADDYSTVNQDWLNRWQEGNIGWHHQEFNPHLLGFWQALGVTAGCRVLVPLCGKSHDMVWLAQQGHDVVGIELSPLAVAAFFDEQQLQPERERDGAFEAWQAGPYRILCGDIFQLQAHHLEAVEAVYDRASLVAFNPQQRRHYITLLNRLLPPDCSLLLVAMDYRQEQMQGPPYSVTAAEVEQLFGEKFSIELLDSLDLLKETDRYRDRGLSHLLEQVYRLRGI
jgi:thiopurine S-methyltransferase